MARVLASVARNPLRVLVALVLSGCAGMIVWNALVLQDARHPAPLFNHPGLAPEAVVPAPPARASGVPLPESAPADLQPSLIDPAPLSASPPIPPARSGLTEMLRGNGEVTTPRAPRATAPVAARPPASQPAVHDPIAEIIRMGGAVPVPPANVGRAEKGDRVLAVQRALAKLGYSVKPDGLMGGETRAAIESFERAQRLPVTGDFDPRTLRALAAASGVALP